MESDLSKDLAAAHREEQAIEAFLEGGSIDIANLTLRPFSAGSLALVRQLGLSLFSGADPESLSESERVRQFTIFVYIQSQPIDEVLAAVKRPNFADVIERFSFHFTLQDIERIGAEIERVLVQAGAAVVDVRAKPVKGGSNEPAPPGNS